MCCAHICRISVFSQYRFVSDTIYRSRAGVVTPRSYLIQMSFFIIIISSSSSILNTKHPTWPRLWSPAQAVAVQDSDVSPWSNAHCSRWDFEEQTSPEQSNLLNGSVLDGWRHGRIFSHPFAGEIQWKKIVAFQFLQLVWISINALHFFFFFFSCSKYGISSNYKIWKQIWFNKISLHDNFWSMVINSI